MAQRACPQPLVWLSCLVLLTTNQAKPRQCEVNTTIDTVDNGERDESLATSLVQKGGGSGNFRVQEQPEPAGRVVAIFPSSGRLGNNLHELLHGLYFAKQIHATHIELGQELGQMPEIMAFPESRAFDIPETDEMRWAPIPEECSVLPEDVSNRWSSGFWTEHCEASADAYRGIGLQMVRPLFRPALAACAEGSTDGENPDETLTVHLRGDDMWGVDELKGGVTELDMASIPNHWLWNHPPCSMYKKIITDWGFKHVVLVTSPDQRHPCIKWPWFQDRANEGAFTFRVQSSTLLNDACALLRARNLVLSFSTFPEAMALLSTRVKRIFSRERFQEHSVMDGNGWEGVTVHQYVVPVNEYNHEQKHLTSMEDLVGWYNNPSDEGIQLGTAELLQAFQQELAYQKNLSTAAELAAGKNKSGYPG